MKYATRLVASGLLLAALVWLTGCEQVSVDTQVRPGGKIVREVVVTAPKEEAQTVRRILEPLLREKGFRYIRTVNDAVVRFRCKVDVTRNRAIFQAEFRRNAPPLCPVGKYTYKETISLTDYLQSKQAKLLAANTEIVYRVLMPGHIVPDKCTSKDIRQSDKLFGTYSSATWKAKVDETVNIEVTSRGRRNFVILFWLVVLGALLYLFRNVPGGIRVRRAAGAEKRRQAREEKARRQAENELRKAEEAREREERQLARERAREGKRKVKGSAEEPKEEAARQPVEEPDADLEPPSAAPEGPKPPPPADSGRSGEPEHAVAPVPEEEPAVPLGYTVTSREAEPPEEPAEAQAQPEAPKRRGLFGRRQRGPTS
jgi:hypothetical protein